MTFQQIAEQYINQLRKEISVGTSTGEATDELSYRMSLDNFFKNVAESIDKKIDRIHEPKNQGKLGRPDWRFHNADSMGVYGYVEAKGLDQKKEIKVSDYESQVERYLVLENPVILTDGIDFVLFTPNEKKEIFKLCNKPINWENPEINLDIEILFKIFFKKVGYRKVTENQLVNEVAKRAKSLSEELMELLELNEEEGETKAERTTIKLLKELKGTAEQSHDKSLIDDKVFAGFIAQILSFGLLYAHRVVDKAAKNPKDKYLKIHDFWFSVLEKEYSDKLIPFKTLVHELKSELDSELSRLGIWYDDLRRLLAHIQLKNEQIEQPDFHELYETFLSVYDPATRFDYGAFYTPKSLAFYTVNLVKAVIAMTLPNLKLETTKQKVIDPCCGTGTFIEAMLERFNLRSNSSIIGFEILPAPYALAHYRMSMLREKYPDNIKIILTNTLSDNLFEEVQIKECDNEITTFLLHEQQVAYQLANPPLTIIVGNPPSSDSSFQVANEGEKIKK
jgi:predicted helicase